MWIPRGSTVEYIYVYGYSCIPRYIYAQVLSLRALKVDVENQLELGTLVKIGPYLAPSAYQCP